MWMNYIIKIIDGGREEDKKLLKKFLSDLPSNGCIDYIRDLGGKTWHKDSLFSHLSIIWHKWDNVEHEFLDKKTEKKKKLFFQNVENYLNYVALNTFSVEHNLDYCGVSEEWREHNLKEYNEVCKKIPEKGRIVAEGYDEFVRFTKQRLNKPKFLWVVYTTLILLLPLIGLLITILVQKYF